MSDSGVRMREKAGAWGNIYYSPTRNSRTTGPVSWSSLAGLSHCSPAKPGATVPSNSVSDDRVQCLLRNFEKLTLAWMMFGLSSWM